MPPVKKPSTEKTYATMSGIPLKGHYGPEDLEARGWTYGVRSGFSGTVRRGGWGIETAVDSEVAEAALRYGFERSTTDWHDLVKNILKAELKRRGVTYAQLVEKLAAIGVVDSEPNIRNKLARGKFTAVFLIQCLEAIGASSLRLE